MRTKLSLVVCVVMLFVSSAFADVQLVRHGKSKHVILLGSKPSLSEIYAADELKAYVQKVTGVELKILKYGIDKYDSDTPLIILGCNKAAANLGVKPTPEQLGQQGFTIQTRDDNIIIAGSPQAGTMYGVFHFLERYFGIRWYAPNVTKIPQKTIITIPELDEKSKIEKPGILHRRTSYYWKGKTNDFFTKVGYNYGWGGDDFKYGVQYAFLGTCHTYFKFIHPKDYFETHPEYFSEIGGVRRKNETQLCLTNPEVLDIVTKKMLAKMKKYHQLSQFNFSQMDYYNYCQCAKCEEINKKYKTPGATQFWFVNKLAERTAKVYPDKLIGTLAYMYSEEVPEGMEIHPNVAVWLCHMFPSCDSHPIKTCIRNADYKRRAIAWSKVCKRMYIWHYTVDFLHYHAPFPNFRSLAADLKFYRDIGVEGIYLQGMGQGGGGGEFHLLRPYYMMKLAWNPDLNHDEVIKDFLQGYYGDAWVPLFKYITMLHDKIEKENIHMHLYTNPGQGFLPDEVIAKAEVLFDQAEANVKDKPVYLDRVKTARMAITYAKIFPRNGYKIEGGRLIFPSIAPTATAAGFVEQMQKRGYKYYREWDNDLNRIPNESAMMNSKPKIETIQNAQLSVEVVPGLAGRALRIIDRKSGKCITAYNIQKSVFFPFCGGHETRVGEIYSYFGFFEPAKVVSKTDNSITVAIKTFDNMDLRRTITLDPNKPIMKVRAVLTNPDKKPRTGRLRTHMSFELGPVRTTKTKFTALNGKTTDEDMTRVLDTLREGIYWRGENIPAGKWTFTGDKGLTVIHRFDPNAIDQTWLSCWPETTNELEMEIWGQSKTLAPGQSIELTDEYEILP